MPGSYRQISQYETEIINLYNQGMTLRAIAEKLGLTGTGVQNKIQQEATHKRIIEAGKAIHKKGRPCKNQGGSLPPSIQQLDKLAHMRYVIASKDRYIKRLEMENELMRDFLSLTERK